MTHLESAPPLIVSEWFNTPEPLHLNALQGCVVMLHTFQMLCPGCVLHGLPQATRVHGLSQAQDVTVIGLHTVFKHHDVMSANAFKAFIHEYRLTFPVGIDARGPGPVPPTMQAYGLQGTPSLVLIDRQGRMRLRHFGRIDDLVLGLLLGKLRAESPTAAPAPQGNARPETPLGAGEDRAGALR